MNHLNITPARFELHAYGETYDVSNSLQDWEEIEVILSLQDFLKIQESPLKQ